MAEENNIHWAANEELLERYVLRRVEADERKILEAHLQTCLECQRAVQLEMELAAGIRRLGRDELKARLKRRVSEKQSSRVSRTQAISIAAAIVVLVTVGLYNKWFFQRNEPKTPTEQVTKEPEQPARAAEQVDKTDKKALPAPFISGDIESKAKPRELANTREAKKQSTEELEKRAKLDQAVTSEKTEIALLRADEGGVWVEGVMLSEPRNGSAVSMPAEAPLKKGARVLSDQKAAAMSTPRPNSRTISFGEISQTVILNQMRMSSLASSQKTTQQKNVIPTQVRQIPDGMLLTMYLDSLFEDSLFRNARVEAVNQDSLIINIGGQYIGYLIPGGWGNRTPQPNVKPKQ